MEAAAKQEEIRGWQEWLTPEGVKVIRLHYTADPDRDPLTLTGAAWKAQALKGIVDGERSNLWRREQEIDWTISEGKAIYQTFREAVHVAKQILLPVRNWPILIGWDYGLTPAAHISQLTPNQHWNWFPSLYTAPGRAVGIKQFTETVVQYLSITYPGYQFVHYGDSAGNSKAQTDERTCFGIQFDDFGILVETGEVTWTARFNSMNEVLRRLCDDGIAMLQIDPRERFVIDAMNGGYCKKKFANSDVYSEEPDKNEYSHVMNGAEYVASRLSLVKAAPNKKRESAQSSALAECYEV